MKSKVSVLWTRAHTQITHIQKHTHSRSLSNKSVFEFNGSIFRYVYIGKNANWDKFGINFRHCQNCCVCHSAGDFHGHCYLEQNTKNGERPANQHKLLRRMPSTRQSKHFQLPLAAIQFLYNHMFEAISCKNCCRMWSVWANVRSKYSCSCARWCAETCCWKFV